ncbi:hypothetical protein CO009_02700 [Candidatus Shapirobacteria bacterium CG_4_8_14_3_um_filter_35_11]|uniref:Ribbon-helix-helix protein CopG domain-containing protein n=5 Tax=Candidatus Shapironibacteriota TaxID=1752721 RepID=A0A1J5HMV4_9BACT|nr:MAG: hypothetical protein AUK05_03600 [Candidatus Shapirobacteria bacterium CG2_30_35_20]PIV07588.1 MAG: hypothetical protein COS53_01640 [Candidatus Shapirobacteria bacterium CG03_land_8_20_14_0_80_35_14]PIX67834.1 MAG: hypothetical protein COZ41_02895 [Candidatus Shapirobacteria bacterium CG_4_10_14_3_um_filter_35_13]PJA51023.1 MAG: hypothetical protein CO168_01995 [Candidatus Shapirobacteria bacterium CG_4_9_14_3_um_filter_36_12]PJC80167.1 MAG: hypothetical protein CO009_02700 [Candidatus
MLVRTQISLPKDLHSTVKFDARKRGISLSEILRQLITEKYYKNPLRSPNENPFAGLITVAQSAPKLKHKVSWSMEIDKYLPENLR